MSIYTDEVQAKQKKTHKISGIILAAISGFSLAFYCYLMLTISFLPLRYVIISAAVLAGLTGFSVFLLLKKETNSKKLSFFLRAVFSCLLSLCMIVVPLGVKSMDKALDTLFELPENGESDMIFVALSSDTITKPEQLFDVAIAVQASDDLANQAYAIDFIQKEYNKELSFTEYEDIIGAIDDLLAGQCRVVLLNQSYFDVIKDNEAYKNLSEDTKVIYKVEILYDLEEVFNNARVTEEPFNILVSGADNYGAIKTIYRSDVNMLVSVTPKTKQILITSLPRDTYVKVPCWNGAYDKLTHASAAGWRSPKGVACSMATIEDFLDVKIDFYVLINFSSVVEIVDTLGGITIDNPYPFTFSYKPYTHFPQGVIDLNGEETLLFVRERKSAKKGDMGRNEHQIVVLRAMLKKMLQPSMLSKANQLFVTLADSYQTNFSSEQISALIKMQLSDLAAWDLHNQSLQGQTARKLSALLTKYQTFSMTIIFPNQLKVAKANIKALLSGEILQDVKLPEGIKQDIKSDTPKKKETK